MKTESILLFFVLTFAICCAAVAKEVQVSLTVSNMTCAACPYIVKKSLTQVEGVRQAQVSYRNKTATVIFDDQITSVSELTKATAGIGFPSRMQE